MKESWRRVWTVPCGRALAPCALTGVLLTGLPAAVVAQDVSAGQRVRVEVSSSVRHTGSLVWLDRDSVVVGTNAGRHTVPAGSLTRMEISLGRRGHPWLGAAVGAAAGIAAGALLFNSSTSACTGSGNYEENCRWYRAGIAVGSAGLGALAGLAIRTERWQSVPPQSVRFQLR